MQTAKTRTSSKRATNLSLDRALLQEARSLGINVSSAAESGIALAVKKQKIELWRKENAAALQTSNQYVATKGLPLSKYHQF